MEKNTSSDLSRYQLAQLDLDGTSDQLSLILSREDGECYLSLKFKKIMVLSLNKFPFARADCTIIEKGSFGVVDKADAHLFLSERDYKYQINEPIPDLYFLDIEGEIGLSLISQEMYSEERPS